MKRILMLLAVVVLLAVPVIAGADGETRMPPEVKWSEQPPTPPTVAVDKERTVSTPQEKIGTDAQVGKAVETVGYLGGYDPAVAQSD
jgi:hypothetical protein